MVLQSRESRSSPIFFKSSLSSNVGAFLFYSVGGNEKYAKGIKQKLRDKQKSQTFNKLFLMANITKFIEFFDPVLTNRFER